MIVLTYLLLVSNTSLTERGGGECQYKTVVLVSVKTLGSPIGTIGL